MPTKHPDPFYCRAPLLNPEVNPYAAKLCAQAASGTLPVAYGSMLASFAGAWREKIGDKNPGNPRRRLLVEIGCHKGLTLTALARSFPQDHVLGLDITFKRVVTTAERLAAQNLKNGFCALANAAALDRLFAPGEVDGLILFFPDPWTQKARQAKHRLVNSAFAARARTVLVPGGFLWLKTDQETYFNGAAEALDGGGFRRHSAPPHPTGSSSPAAQAASGGSASPLGFEFDSAFERRYRSQGLPIYSGVWCRPKSDNLEKLDVPGTNDGAISASPQELSPEL